MGNPFYNRDMSQPFQLYNLQKVDSQLDLSKNRIKEIDITIKDDTGLRDAETKFNTATSNKDLAQRELKRSEEEVETQQTKIDNNQKTLYSGTVSNTKELEDLQNEAAALKRYLNTLEERQLEKMIAFEDFENLYSQSQEYLETVKTKQIQTNSLLSGERSTLITTIEKLETDRLIAAEVIESENLKIYNKLREKKRGRAVAKVKDSICAACGSLLTAAQAQEARSPTIITCCNSCGRVLYSD